MSKNAKQYAQEMLKMSTSGDGRKEVVNACLFVLKVLSENSSMNPKDIEKITGGTIDITPTWFNNPDPHTVGGLVDPLNG